MQEELRFEVEYWQVEAENCKLAETRQARAASECREQLQSELDASDAELSASVGSRFALCPPRASQFLRERELRRELTASQAALACENSESCREQELCRELSAFEAQLVLEVSEWEQHSHRELSTSEAQLADSEVQLAEQFETRQRHARSHAALVSSRVAELQEAELRSQHSQLETACIFFAWQREVRSKPRSGTKTPQQAPIEALEVSGVRGRIRAALEQAIASQTLGSAILQASPAGSRVAGYVQREALEPLSREAHATRDAVQEQLVSESSSAQLEFFQAELASMQTQKDCLELQLSEARAELWERSRDAGLIDAKPCGTAVQELGTVKSLIPPSHEVLCLAAQRIAHLRSELLAQEREHDARLKSHIDSLRQELQAERIQTACLSEQQEAGQLQQRGCRAVPKALSGSECADDLSFAAEVVLKASRCLEDLQGELALCRCSEDSSAFEEMEEAGLQHDSEPATVARPIIGGVWRCFSSAFTRCHRRRCAHGQSSTDDDAEGLSCNTITEESW